MNDCAVGASLLTLRRDLAWDKSLILGEYFHAATDTVAVRQKVFEEILKHDFTVQATIMEKSKAQHHIRVDKATFYKYGWYYHFRHGISRDIRPNDQLHVTAACLGTRKEQRAFTGVVNDVVRQHVKIPRDDWTTDFCPAAADPCLQVADYCSWAIQRKWEQGDDGWYRLIAGRTTYEFDLWSAGRVHHY